MTILVATFICDTYKCLVEISFHSIMRTVNFGEKFASYVVDVQHVQVILVHGSIYGKGKTPGFLAVICVEYDPRPLGHFLGYSFLLAPTSKKWLNFL